MGGKSIVSKGIELKDDVLDKSVYGGDLEIENGGWFHNARVMDENKRCIYDTYFQADALEWAKKHAAVGETIYFYDFKKNIHAYTKIAEDKFIYHPNTLGPYF